MHSALMNMSLLGILSVWALALVPSCAPQASTSSVSATAIPAVFHGRWTPHSSGIHVPGEDPLGIGKHRIISHESEGEVTEVRIHGPSDITVTCRLSGEGEEWIETCRYTVAPDGNSMLVHGEPQRRLYRIR